MRTLLLADDSITVQRVITLTFADEPVRVVAVSDGQQALEKLASLRPDIVLAGTTLPQVNGYDLAAFMRGRPELRDVPVLLLSGAFESVDEARLKASGANGFLEKPVEPTIVIGRVRELLGLKSDEKPATAGRLITSAEAPEKPAPVATTPRAVTSTRGTPTKWDQLRDDTGLDANTQSVEDPSTRSDDYLDTLDAAFDTLDQQLSGRAVTKHSQNPSGPLGQSGGAADPRSPGRRPQDGMPGNPVFEVDDEWFGGSPSQARAEATAGRRDIQEDLRDPDLPGAEAAESAVPGVAPSTIFEVDDEWFAADNQAKAAKVDEQRELAAEMGIHDVDLPAVDAPLTGARPVSHQDFDFGLDDIRKIQEAPVAEPAAKAAPVASVAAQAPPPFAASPVADDFAALLAYEQGERPAPPPEPKTIASQITDAMLDQIASRVAERLNAGMFGDQLNTVMTNTVRETVRTVVSETSERLVRDEIDRIKSQS